MDNADALIAELEANYNISKAANQLEADEEFRRRTAGAVFEAPLWNCLKAEVYELLCKKSSKYHREREALKHSVAPAVGILSAWLTKECGIGAGAASGLAAAALLVPLKLSLNAWCDVMKDKGWMTDADRKTLRELGNRKPKRR